VSSLATSRELLPPRDHHHEIIVSMMSRTGDGRRVLVKKGGRERIGSHRTMLDRKSTSEMRVLINS